MVALELKARGSHTTCLFHFKDFKAPLTVLDKEVIHHFCCWFSYTFWTFKRGTWHGQGISGAPAGFQIKQSRLLFWVRNRNKEKGSIVLSFLPLCSRFRDPWRRVIILTEHILFPIYYSLAIYSSLTAFSLINMTFTYFMGDFFFTAVSI